ncbi:hypothetical protein JOM56_012997 [Amanita muscaria]
MSFVALYFSTLLRLPQPAAQQQVLQLQKDPFYGHEPIARLCARFITFLFTCPKRPPSSHTQQPKLPHFIAYALHQTKLHPFVVFAGLIVTADVYTTCNKAQQRVTSSRMQAATRGLWQWLYFHQTKEPMYSCILLS